MSILLTPSEYLRQTFSERGIALNDKQTAQFLIYADLLEQKNAVMNLTAITGFEEVVRKHFLDSCAPAYVPGVFPDSKAVRLIDIGSGAGFPGIPLKILYPEMEAVLLDSLQKRVGFLEEVIHALDLKGISAVHARAEDGARREDLREQFDLAVSRAVAALPVLAEYCLPYVKTGGSFVAYKGADSEKEAEAAEAAVKTLGGKTPEIRVFTVADADGEPMGRSLIRIGKARPTPKKYPRKAGTAAKSPLT